MRRFTIVSALLLLAGIPVAAVVRAQDTETQDSPSWSQRWGALKKSLGSDGREPGEVPKQNWSADRRFGAPMRSSKSDSNSSAEATERKAIQAQPAPQALQPQGQTPRSVMTANTAAKTGPAAVPTSPTASAPASSRRTAGTGLTAQRSSSNGLRSPNEPTPAVMPQAMADKFDRATSPTPASPTQAAPPTTASKGLSLQERIAASRQSAGPSDPASEETPARPERFAARPQMPTNQRTAVAETAPAATAETTPTAVPHMAKVEQPSATGATNSIVKGAANPARAIASDENVLFARKSPQLSVETTGPRSIVIGKEASYTVTIANSGEVAGQDVVVSVKVPAWADVVNARMTSGSTKPLSQASANEPFQWNIPRVEAKSRQELVLQLVPRESKPFDLAVQFTFAATASQTLVEVQEPKLAMTLSGPEEVLFGETKNYSIALSNPGSGTAENVAIELMPLGDGQGGARQVVGNIAAGENKVITVELTARQTGSVSIRAKATADGGLVSEASEQVLVRRADLEVDVEGPKFTYAGTLVSYSIKIANPGNATAESVEVSAALPSGAKLVSCSAGGQPSSDGASVKWTFGGLRSGGDMALEVKCIPSSAGPNRLEAVARASGDLTDKGAIVTSVEALADLKLEVTDPKGPVPIGEDMMYEIHIINRGSRSAENIEILAFFSEGIEPVAVQGGQHEILPGQVIFRPIHTLAADSDIIYKIKARAGKSGNHIFRAEVNCQPLGTRLAAEETTYFFGEEVAATTDDSYDAEPTPAGVEPAQLQEPLTPIGMDE